MLLIGGTVGYVFYEQSIYAQDESIQNTWKAEINKLIQYLKYDILSDEFIVSCDFKLSLVAAYPSDRILGFFSNFNSEKDKALPLFVFIDEDPGNNHPEYFI